MQIHWFQNEDHLVYINGATQLADLERTLHFPGLVVPDLTFGQHIQMGENVFFYMGEMQECYVIYWPDAPVAK